MRTLGMRRQEPVEIAIPGLAGEVIWYPSLRSDIWIHASCQSCWVPFAYNNLEQVWASLTDHGHVCGWCSRDILFCEDCVKSGHLLGGLCWVCSVRLLKVYLRNNLLSYLI